MGHVLQFDTPNAPAADATEVARRSRRSEVFLTECPCEACSELDLWMFKLNAVLDGYPSFDRGDLDHDDAVQAAILAYEPLHWV